MAWAFNKIEFLPVMYSAAQVGTASGNSNGAIVGNKENKIVFRIRPANGYIFPDDNITGLGFDRKPGESKERVDKSSGYYSDDTFERPAQELSPTAARLLWRVCHERIMQIWRIYSAMLF